MYVCEKCGCKDVEEKAWVRINTGKLVDIVEDETPWCPQCEKETSIIDDEAPWCSNCEEETSVVEDEKK